MKLDEQDVSATLYAEITFWVYLLCDEDLEVIYVGSTTNLHVRMRAHSANIGHTLHGIRECDSYEEMIHAEKLLIDKYQPRLNKAGVTSEYFPPHRREN